MRRYLPRVERIVAGALGPDTELDDVVHDVFVRALEGVGALKDPGALAGWLSTLAVFTAREKIRLLAPLAVDPLHRARGAARGTGARGGSRRARDAAGGVPRAGDVARRRTGGVRAALHRRDGADRGRGGVRLFARDDIKLRLARAETSWRWRAPRPRWPSDWTAAGDGRERRHERAPRTAGEGAGRGAPALAARRRLAAEIERLVQTPARSARRHRGAWRDR